MHTGMCAHMCICKHRCPCTHLFVPLLHTLQKVLALLAARSIMCTWRSQLRGLTELSEDGCRGPQEIAFDRPATQCQTSNQDSRHPGLSQPHRGVETQFCRLMLWLALCISHSGVVTSIETARKFNVGHLITIVLGTHKPL